jgi:hypothetical protein
LAEVPATVVALARSGRIVAARSVADLVAAVRR